MIHQLDKIEMDKSVYHQALLAADRQSEKPQEINTLLGSELSSEFTGELNSINAHPHI